MATTDAPVTSVLHPRAAEFMIEPRELQRRIGLLFAASGIAIVAAMGVLGLLMRLTQAEVLGLSQAWFYRLMTLHGGGMLVGVLLVMMGALWYVLRSSVPLRTRWVLWSYGLLVAGAVLAIVATLIGGFAAGWTFLPPLSSFGVGQWPVWSESVFFVAMLLVGTGFLVYCLDVLEQTTSTYGGLKGALGWRYLRGLDSQAPPPQVIAATVVAIDGLLAMAAGTAIVVGLLGRTYDSGVGFDLLVAKNLVYFFGHTIFNLVIYLAAGAVYVLLPRYAGRPYKTNKVFVAAWMASLVFIATAYSHHLYMDFVQPLWAQTISQVASYFALIPVAVITIYSMSMMVWGSRYRWTLGSTLLYVGLGGWAIGGVGAVIDSLIPINFRLHNTAWVVAHFHTYLMMTVILWGLAFAVHLFERDGGVTSSRRARLPAIALLLVGGYGLTATWFVAGALGVPRRYAIQPAGTVDYSVVGSIFAIVFALGVAVCLVQIIPLARATWARRHDRMFEDIERQARTQHGGGQSRTAVAGAVAVEPAAARRGQPFSSAAQLAAGVAVCVVGLVTFFPQVVDASETSIRYHHLNHAGQFLLGTILGLLLGSRPIISLKLGDRPGWGLAAVILAPTVMMLLMVPRLYDPLETNAGAHTLYHVGMAGFGLVTGLGASRQTALGGWFLAFLSIGMSLLFAAAMTGS